MQPLPRDLGGGLAALAIPVPVRTAYAAGCHAGRLLSELSYLAHALAQAMEDLCRNSARRLQMGRIARQRAGEYFRHEDMIANYLDTYDEVFRRWYMVE